MPSFAYRDVVCAACGHRNRRFGFLVDGRDAHRCDACAANLATGRIDFMDRIDHVFTVAVLYLGAGFVGWLGASLLFGLSARSFLNPERQPALWDGVATSFQIIGVVCGLAWAEGRRRTGNLLTKRRTTEDTPAERESARSQAASQVYPIAGAIVGGFLIAFPISTFISFVGLGEWNTLFIAIATALGVFGGMGYTRLRRNRGDFK